MDTPNSDSKRILRLANAFKQDGYEVCKIITRFNNRIGMTAEHKTAANYDTGERKKVYYLEGTNYEMGYLLGSLAEREISAMSRDFAERIVFAYIGTKVLEKVKVLRDALISIIYLLARRVLPDLPQEIKDELQGIYDGCKAYNPRTRVDMEHLIALNTGFDILCAMVYSGNFLLRDLKIEPNDFKIPIMCNGFSLFGKAAGNGHYFGRDFMFPSAGVFQDMAAMIIYNPDSSSGKPVYPFVGITAPGIVGSISAMNIHGVGIGVNMSPSGNCDPERVGLNSLLLSRICAQFGSSADHVVKIIEEAPRGVSWNYVIADGKNDRACVVEAGRYEEHPGFLQYPPSDMKKFLPDMDFIDNHRSGEFRHGLMVRWSDYQYPADYLDYNRLLWSNYNKSYLVNKQLYPDSMDEYGYINRTNKEKNCPSCYYFAPQREKQRNIIVTTNHFIIPEMRFYAMYPWTALVVGDQIHDIQWRYDELNHQILSTLKEKERIDYREARDLIDFLAPYGKYPSYYAGSPKSQDGKEVRIEGCTSVFDLKSRTVESHYGYYCDPWVKVTLPNYI